MMHISAGRIAQFVATGDWGDEAREKAYAGHRWPTESLIADLKEVACQLLPELDERPLTAAMAETLTRTDAHGSIDHIGGRHLSLVANSELPESEWADAWNIIISRDGTVFAEVYLGDYPIHLFNPTVGQFFTACRLAGIKRTVAEAEWRKLGVAPAAAP